MRLVNDHNRVVAAMLSTTLFTPDRLLMNFNEIAEDQEDMQHGPVERAANEQGVQAIRRTLIETSGVSGVHDVRARKMGDMIVVDAHIEVDAAITVEAGHDIAVAARQRVLNLMTHVDPWRRRDLDHRTIET